MASAALSRPPPLLPRAHDGRRVDATRRHHPHPETLPVLARAPAAPAACPQSPSAAAAAAPHRRSWRRRRDGGVVAPRRAAAASSGGDAAETPPPSDAPTPQQRQQPPSTTPTDPNDDPPLWPRIAALLQQWTGEASPIRLLDPPLAAFLAGGVVVGAGLLNWVRAVSPLRRISPYQFTVVFSEAHKVGEGTPVRMKGVEIGVVKKVDVRPDAVAVGVEVFSGRQVVPLQSRIDVNALGLMADAIIDITPPENFAGGVEGAAAVAGSKRATTAAATMAGPRDPRCAAEARIVCDGARVAGHQGANMNFMMRLWLEHNDRTRTKVEW